LDTYNDFNFTSRRSKCFEAAKLLGLTSLREASHRDIEAKKALFADDDVMYRRFRHVVSEIDRTVKSAEALKNKDYGLFGKFMIESHNSLR
jgi:galactokinase